MNSNRERMVMIIGKTLVWQKDSKKKKENFSLAKKKG